MLKKIILLVIYLRYIASFVSLGGLFSPLLGYRTWVKLSFETPCGRWNHPILEHVANKWLTFSKQI
jgi:hypothetical protein